MNIEVSTPTIKVKVGDTELVLTQEEATQLRDAISAALPKVVTLPGPNRQYDYPLGPYITVPNPQVVPSFPSRNWDGTPIVTCSTN